MLESQTIDPEEQTRFNALAKTWWDPQGSMRILHDINPIRLKFICDILRSHFHLKMDDLSLESLSILDTGCGGGLVCEPLSRLGGKVTGIDMSEDLIAIAKTHAHEARLPIEYHHTSLETFAAHGQRFDVVLALEVIEHVNDVGAFIKLLESCVRPGGILILSTFNRTVLSFLAGIVMAEYVLGWLPRHTHQWDKFITPEELSYALSSLGFKIGTKMGLCFRPLSCAWSLDASDLAVNYFLTAHK
jgi:2-polyprenyl-6-hydroxyphenyl methylase/3-demethylubiquinone-9 3-methyltransferase